MDKNGVFQGERGVDGVEVGRARVVGDVAQGLAEALIVHDLPFAQEAQGREHVGVVNQADEVVVGGARLLLRGHILVQVRDGIALGLEVGGGKGRAAGGLGPDAQGVIDIVGVKALRLDVVHAKAARQLPDDRGDDLQMRQLLGANIGQQRHGVAAGHGVALV